MVEWKTKEDWHAQEFTIIGTFEKVKVNCQGRNTKLMLAIIADEEPKDKMSGDTKVTVDDFLNNIRRVCQVESRCVFVVPRNSIENAINVRTGKIISDLANAYYKEVGTKIRKYKNEVKKEVQPYLFIRHRFKVAFYFEILKSNAKALKYYSQAYPLIHEISTNDYSIEELRTVADYLNFKICQLQLKEKKISQAVKQFLTHISWYYYSSLKYFNILIGTRNKSEMKIFVSNIMVSSINNIECLENYWKRFQNHYYHLK